MRLASRSLISSCSVLAACAALAAGCFRSSGAPPSGTAPTTGAPAGPAPTVTWIDNGFDTTRLPAVSADGTKVLIPTQDSDGGRGNPNFRVAVKNREDAEVATKVVLTVAEAEPMFDGGTKHPELDKRIAAANAWLAEQNTALRLQPLAPLEVEDHSDGALPASFRATGRGVTLEWKNDRVKIVQGDKTLVDRTTPNTWLVKDKPMYPGAGPDETCHNPAFLQGASIDLERKIALLTINYYGTDSCWEPPATHHVVAW